MASHQHYKATTSNGLTLFQDLLCEVFDLKTRYTWPLNNFLPELLSPQQLSLEAWPRASSSKRQYLHMTSEQLLSKSQRTFPTQSLSQEQKVPTPPLRSSAAHRRRAHGAFSVFFRRLDHTTNLTSPWHTGCPPPRRAERSIFHIKSINWSREMSERCSEV